ncbi:gp039 [Rhodococcus phage ReqiDocB7]|uniref:gp039 n=1 Tax=Rhodococcus phage ReqiDocB7 TaxID=691966 RepID=UPI0001CDD769|nr:gp039 [Rhodococcus phage ReqiDocB7]ADD80825.1 gp039 [Rhodococcus phage ReqiDocB7]
MSNGGLVLVLLALCLAILTFVFQFAPSKWGHKPQHTGKALGYRAVTVDFLYKKEENEKQSVHRSLGDRGSFQRVA